MGSATPEEAAVRDVPGRTRRILATSVSPDGRKAVVLWEDGKRRYLLVSHCVREADGWTEYLGPSSAGTGWAYIPSVDKDDDELGVVCVSGEAPPDAVAAVLRWRGEEHTVPVRDERFLFAAWDVPYSTPLDAEVVSYVDARGVRRPP